MPKKTYWRCTICGDLHYGVKPPKECPTCGFGPEKAVEVTKEQFIDLANN